ncbi:MAG: amino acid permease [Thermoplasmatota archaeon]
MPKSKEKESRGHGFGTAPVFLTSICAIMGAVMFLRFGFTVGNVGLIGAVFIVLLGHLITVPTGMAISEIATNLRVRGGGEYYILSRSFGLRIGATIGVMLYAAQSISIAFYIIGFSEGVQPFVPFIQEHIFDPLPLSITYDPRMISVPIAVLLFSIILLRGAKIGIKLLWGVFAAMVASIIIFFISPPFSGAPSGVTETASGSLGFFSVFAIAFPAFTGMTAGVGLSGDLKEPNKAIPRGIILAIAIGFFVYLGMMLKLWLSVPVDSLSSNMLIIYDLSKGIGSVSLGVVDIHLGFVFLLGLFGATLSSAVGFALIAPRTLQALGKDKVFIAKRITDFIKAGKGKENEPVNGTLISSIIAITFVYLGNLNTVAEIITMFFLLTYGSVCLISFLEHFAGNPSYRPTFRTKWYISLIGAVLSLFIMFQLNPVYALLTLIIMVGIYFALGFKHKRSRSFAIIFQGVMFQLSRVMKITLQRTMSKPDKYNWRPSIILVSTNAMERKGPKEILRWISHHYGFGTLVHLIKGRLNSSSIEVSRRDEKILVKEMRASKANYSITTLVSPSILTAIAQTLQISGVSGMDNNTIMFEFHKDRNEELNEILQGLRIAKVVKYNKLVLRSTDLDFGLRRDVHLWITKEDFRNINLMILLAYIITQHRDWKDSEIKIFTLFSRGEKKVLAKKVKDLIAKGRIPISQRSVRSKVYDTEKDMIDIINRYSSKADLTMIGFNDRQLSQMGEQLFTRYKDAKDTIFVSASQELLIT